MKKISLIQLLDTPEPLTKVLSLKPEFVYSRQHDDTDGLPLQNLLIKTDLKNNVNLKLEFKYPTEWMTFNAPENGGQAYYTHRALMVVAAAIQLDNEFGRTTLHQKPKTTLLDLFDNHKNWSPFPNVKTDASYEILADSLNTDIGLNDLLNIHIARDGDAHVWDMILPNSLRFRNMSGGGRSLRTNYALYLLAEAIYRDNNTINRIKEIKSKSK